MPSSPPCPAALLLGTAGLVLLTLPGAAQGRSEHRRLLPHPSPSFQGLGDLPGGLVSSLARAIAPDGATVVGSSVSAQGTEAVVWTASGGLVALGDLPGGSVDAEAKGVSTGGGVIVGAGTGPNGLEAFRWTPSTGMVGLGDLPGGSDFSVATDVDAAGAIVVGYGEGANGTEAWSWTELDGMAALGDLPGGAFASRALRISADGTVIVGDSSSFFGPLACRWQGGVGPVDLHPNGDPLVPFSANAVSLNGATIGGQAAEGAEPTAFLWSGNAVSSLGTSPYQTLGTQGLSHDARRAVGTGFDGSQTRAWIWDEGVGVRDLQGALVQEYGLTEVTRWIRLEAATDISGDGNRIVGFGTNPQGNREAFLAFAPIPCRVDLDQSGSVDLGDVATFAAATQNGQPLADFDGDGFFTIDDARRFWRAYQKGCR